MLIFDEVQTGLGRTGHWFFAGSPNAGHAVPDIITLAKSLGSGIPVGANLVGERIASGIKENDLGTTFGGGMIAMASVLATIEAIENDEMIRNAGDIEKYVRDLMAQVPHVVSVRGKGCLLGIEFKELCSEIHTRLLERKIITGTSSDPRVLRLLPPLNVTRSQIDQFAEALRGS